jgi:hypothetical protein
MQNIIEFPDRHLSKMQGEVAQEVSKAGHPHTPADANPNDQKPLATIAEIIKGKFGDRIRDAEHAINTAGVFIEGEDPGKYNRGADNPVIIDLARERQKRMKNAA